MADDPPVSVYEYPDEVIVEFTGTDEFGEVAVTTYQFSPGDAPEEVLPKQSIERDHLPVIEDALEASGYHLTSSKRDVA